MFHQPETPPKAISTSSEMLPLKLLTTCVVMLSLLSSCAPQGYRYGALSASNPGQAFQLRPDDACQDQRLISPGALQDMNASVGKPDGFPKPVTSIDSISSIGYGPPLGFDPGPPASVRCYETVTFGDGTQRTGTVDITDENKGLSLTWTPQPSQITSQQSAKDTLAAEQFEADSQECSDNLNEKMDEVSNLSLEAQANGGPFDITSYMADAEQVFRRCQKDASLKFHNVFGSQK